MSDTALRSETKGPEFANNIISLMPISISSLMPISISMLSFFAP